MIDDTLTGLSLHLRHATALAAVCALLLTHASLGGWVFRRLRVSVPHSASWRWAVSASLGAGVLASLNFVLGVFGLMRPAVVLTVAGAALALTWHDASKLLSDLRDHFMRLSGRALEPADIGPVLILGIVFVAALGALAPTTDWDSLMYHLRVPTQFLEEGRIYLPRDNFHVALVGVAQMSTLPLLAAGIANGPALMQVAAIVLLFVATGGLARSVGIARTGWMATISALVGCPILLLVGITARVDVTLALMLIAAHLSLLGATESDALPRDRRVLLFIAAALIGFSVGIKPQAGAYAIALVPLGWRAAAGWCWALLATALSLLVFLPWGLKNHLLVGSIAYPVGVPPWFVPWIADLYGSKVIGSQVDQAILDALGDARASFNVMDAFLNPSRLTIEGEGGLYRLSPALLLLPLAALGWRERRASGVVLVACGYALLVVLPFGRINLRYLLPALPGLAIGVGLGVERLLATQRSAPRRLLLAFTCTVAMLPLWPAVHSRFISSTVLVRHAAGRASAAEVWMQHPDFAVSQLAVAVRAVSAQVPESGLVLMLFEPRGFAFDRRVLQDVLLSNWSYVSQSPAAGSCLAGSGITHVLVNTGAISYYVNRGVEPQYLRLQELQRFAQRCLGERVFMASGMELWTLLARPRVE